MLKGFKSHLATELHGSGVAEFLIGEDNPYINRVRPPPRGSIFEFALPSKRQRFHVNIERTHCSCADLC